MEMPLSLKSTSLSDHAYKSPQFGCWQYHTISSGTDPWLLLRRLFHRQNRSQNSPNRGIHYSNDNFLYFRIRLQYNSCRRIGRPGLSSQLLLKFRPQYHHLYRSRRGLSHSLSINRPWTQRCLGKNRSNHLTGVHWTSTQPGRSKPIPGSRNANLCTLHVASLVFVHLRVGCLAHSLPCLFRKRNEKHSRS